MWVLYNAAHCNSSIRSHDGEAWIRILGFFDTKELALDHSRSLTKNTKMEIRIAPEHCFRMILKNMCFENLLELRESEAKKYSFLITTHKKLREHSISQTYKNAETRTMGFESKELFLNNTIKSKEINDLNLSAEGDGDDDEHSSARFTLSNAYDCPSILKDNEIRMQKFAALSVIPDYQAILQRSNLTKKLYTEQKNKIIRDKIAEGFHLPSLEELSKNFLEQNPPPSEIEGSSEEQEIMIHKLNNWKIFRDCAVEDELFARMNAEKPNIQAIEEKSSKLVKSDEPAVMFLGVSDREEEMESKIQKMVDTDVTLKHYDIACVAMYEWLSVKNMSETKRVKYRDANLTKMHEARQSHSEESSLLQQKGVRVIEV
jgi:hypothetical protein